MVLYDGNECKEKFREIQRISEKSNKKKLTQWNF